MSMRGGYQIIDLKDAPLYSGFLEDYGENHITIKGIYYNLYHSNAKMILLSGLNMDNRPHRDYEIIPYEENNEFKAILKKVWNTDKHIVYTYFLHIADDDDVYITYEELDYDRVDTKFNENSDIAIANSTVTKKVNELDEEDLTFVKLDGSRSMTGDLNVDGHTIIGGRNKTGSISNMTLLNCKLSNNFNAANKKITNLAQPTTDYDAARLSEVNDLRQTYQMDYYSLTLANNPFKIDINDGQYPSNNCHIYFTPTTVEFKFEIVETHNTLRNVTTVTDVNLITQINNLFTSRGDNSKNVVEFESRINCYSDDNVLIPVTVKGRLDKTNGAAPSCSVEIYPDNPEATINSIHTYTGCALLLDGE